MMVVRNCLVLVLYSYTNLLDKKNLPFSCISLSRLLPEHLA